MTVGRASMDEPAWCEAPARRGRVRGLLPLALALAAGVAAASIVPSAGYVARAFVMASDRSGALPGGASEDAGAAVVPNPVISRAASSLIGAGYDVPAPDAVERTSVTLGLAGATGAEARLALDIARNVRARTDRGSGTLGIEALAPDAGKAIRLATAVAIAFVADQDELAAKGRHQREAEIAARLDRLKAASEAARRRLAEFGPVEADPAQARAAATLQVAAAQERAETIRAIIGSGTPPLSDRRGVPAAIETLQATYLDLSRQLAKARETLGDRHTTIISLQDGLRRAAVNVNAEWKRLQRVADTELQNARARAADLQKAVTPADAKRRDAANEARRRVQLADEALAQAQILARDAASTDGVTHLSARPALSAVPVGYAETTRGLIAILAGLLVFAFGKVAPSLLQRARNLGEGSPATSDAAIAGPAAPSDRPQMPGIAAMSAALGAPRPAEAKRDRALTSALGELLRQAQPLSSRFGNVPTIMVASLEADCETTSAALAVGRAAARDGQNVLILELDRPETTLAAAVAMHAEPILVDLFGTLRVALRADDCDGFLYLAPSLDRGDAIAAALARGSDTRLVEDLASNFQLIVVDGGHAAESVADRWGADAYLRVGRFASHRDDANLLAAFDDRSAPLLGSIVDGTLSSPVVPKPVPSTARGNVKRAAVRSSSAATPQHFVVDRRPSALRRSSNSRFLSNDMEVNQT